MSDTIKLIKECKRYQRREICRRLLKNKLAMASIIVLIIFALMAIFADLIADYRNEAIGIAGSALEAPSAQHWFGTDHLGRDVFARIVHGARISLSLGLMTTLVSLIIGGLLGAAAGYFGGWVDNAIMRIMDILLCIPAILLALAIIAALGTSTLNLIIAITIASVPGFTRIIRSAVLTVVGQEFIMAARSYGAGSLRILLKYVLPNAIGPIIVEATMAVAGMIITAASLSFLGMGIEPQQPEWGAMLSDAKNYMLGNSYLVLFPGMAIIMSALALNLLGDGLRDALDPRLKD